MPSLPLSPIPAICAEAERYLVQWVCSNRETFLHEHSCSIEMINQTLNKLAAEFGFHKDSMAWRRVEEHLWSTGMRFGDIVD